MTLAASRVTWVCVPRTCQQLDQCCNSAVVLSTPGSAVQLIKHNAGPAPGTCAPTRTAAAAATLTLAAAAPVRAAEAGHISGKVASLAGSHIGGPTQRMSGGTAAAAQLRPHMFQAVLQLLTVQHRSHLCCVCDRAREGGGCARVARIHLHHPEPTVARDDVCQRGLAGPYSTWVGCVTGHSHTAGGAAANMGRDVRAKAPHK